jgi:hypothetical protein
MDSADVRTAAAVLAEACTEGRLGGTETMDQTTTPQVLQWYQAAE